MRRRGLCSKGCGRLIAAWSGNGRPPTTCGKGCSQADANRARDARKAARRPVRALRLCSWSGRPCDCPVSVCPLAVTS